MLSPVDARARLGGVIVPTVTPFDAQGRLDLPAFRDVLEFLVAQGANAVVPGDLVGELFALTLDERRTLLAEAVAACRGRMLVIALTAAPSGFCARVVITAARTPLARAAASRSGTGPSSSTATGTTVRPRAATRSSRLAQPGSSIATESPGRRWAVSSRSMASSVPEVTVIAAPSTGTPSAANLA